MSKDEAREEIRQEMALRREELLGPVLHLLIPDEDRSPVQRREFEAMEARWRQLLVDGPTRLGTWKLVGSIRQSTAVD